MDVVRLVLMSARPAGHTYAIRPGPASFIAALLLIAVAFAVCPAGPAALPFAPDSVWNAPLPASAPIAADSAAVVAELQRQVQSAGVWINTRAFSVPVYTVPARQPVVRVQLDTSYRRCRTISIACRSRPAPVPRRAPMAT